MADSAIEKRVRELAGPLCDELGLFLWDVKFLKEGANWYLRVFIDKDGGISLSDCEALHRPLDALLDEADPIPQSYTFEVCSPGLERKLERPEHFEVCIGDPIKLRLYSPRDGKKELSGTLEDYGGGVIKVEGAGEINVADCAWIKLDDDVGWNAGIS